MVRAEECIACLYVEGQPDGETLRGMTSKALKEAGIPSDQIDPQLDVALASYKAMGFDMTMAIKKACNDPFRGMGSMKTCESKGKCGVSDFFYFLYYFFVFYTYHYGHTVFNCTYYYIYS